jgi:hypothetical protein
MNHIGRFGLLLGIVFFASGIQPLWADTTNIDINIGYGSGGGYSYSGIHAATRCGSNNLCMGGAKLYWPLTGTLNADLNTDGPISLANITGTLTATGGDSMFISSGKLYNNASGKATGYLKYALMGTYTGTGTFYFVGDQMCCNGAPNGGPNNLTASGFTLWGNNWDVTMGETKSSVPYGLGIDLVGGQYKYTPTPEPSTMMLLGSGLLALPFLRKKKR